jgi:hypothetical protein
MPNFSKKGNLPTFDLQSTLRDILGDDCYKIFSFLAIPSGAGFVKPQLGEVYSLEKLL